MNQKNSNFVYFKTYFKQKNIAMKNVMIWLPRAIMILFILFISLFALDAFDGDESFIRKLGGFAIHLVPTFILIILLILSWKREWIGSIFFIVLGIFYIVWAWGKFPLVTYITISGPLILSGILFRINWVNRKALKNQNNR